MVSDKFLNDVSGAFCGSNSPQGIICRNSTIIFECEHMYLYIISIKGTHDYFALLCACTSLGEMDLVKGCNLFVIE